MNILSNMHEQEKLEQGAVETLASANKIEIKDQKHYDEVVEFCKEVKRRQAQITEFWKEPKEQANKAHKAITSREKEMLTPLIEAELVAKRAMGIWSNYIEMERRKAEIELAKKQQALIDEQNRKAEELEKQGDNVGASITRSSASLIAETAGSALPVQKTEGVTYKETWKAEVYDATRVPAYLNGVELREINITTLNRLGQASKGSVQVDGVRFVKETSVSVRK